MSRLTWKKESNETGLARVCQGPRGFDLRLNGNHLISVRPLGNGFDKYTITGWYWYGLYRNTYNENLTFSTVEEAKADAMKAAKEKLNGK